VGVAYDSGKGEIFVANYASNTVSVISDIYNFVVTNVSVGSEPLCVAYDSGKGEIFVSNFNSNPGTVMVISDGTYGPANTVVATLYMGLHPWGVAYDSAKGEIFVSNGLSGTGPGVVLTYSDSTNAVIANMTVGSWPTHVVYDSGKGEIFVANDGSNTVSVYSILVAPSVSSSPGTVDQGQTSNLTSTAVTTGAAPYKYQWLSEAPGASSYSSIGGATSSSYNFVTSTSTATGSWSFILQVADATGAVVNSNAATVTVNVAPTVSVTPASWTMDVGQSKLFTSSVSGGTSPYSYQWYLNGSAVSGATSAAWTFTPSSIGSYNVYVVVTDAVGAVAVTSSTVTVLPVIPEFPATIPLILMLSIVSALILALTKRRKPPRT
jgi:YVTN family beta-propeller protein